MMTMRVINTWIGKLDLFEYTHWGWHSCAKTCSR